MHDVRVKMMDGRTCSGILWLWRPKDGYMDLVVEPYSYPEFEKDGEYHDGLLRLRFRNIAEAVEKGVMESVNRVEDVDLLAKAREDGWKSEIGEKE